MPNFVLTIILSLRLRKNFPSSLSARPRPYIGATSKCRTPASNAASSIATDSLRPIAPIRLEQPKPSRVVDLPVVLSCMLSIGGTEKSLLQPYLAGAPHNLRPQQKYPRPLVVQPALRCSASLTASASTVWVGFENPDVGNTAPLHT